MRKALFLPLLCLFLFQTARANGEPGDVKTVIPDPVSFVELCGFQTNRLKEYDYRAVFSNGWGPLFGVLEDDNTNLSGPVELEVALLMEPPATNVPPLTAEGVELINRLSARERGLYAIYMFRELRRCYPGRSDLYDGLESDVKAMFGLSGGDIDAFCENISRVYLISYALKNRDLPLLYSAGGQRVMNPVYSNILRYMKTPSWHNRNVLNGWIRNIVLRAVIGGVKSDAYRKYLELKALAMHYTDIGEMFLECESQILAREYQAPYLDFAGPERKLMDKAVQVCRYLYLFPYEENEAHSYPGEIEKRGSMDSDDFSFYAYLSLKKLGIPAKVLEIDYGGISYHYCCVFQVGSNWLLMDQDKGILPDRKGGWGDLPGLLFRRLVYYRVVDIEKTWMKGIEEEDRIHRDDEKHNESGAGDYREWIQSGYMEQDIYGFRKK